MKKIIAIISALSLAAGLTVMANAANYYGDVDKNGSVNSADALVILEYAVGSIKEIDKKSADMNRDKVINSTDALCVLRTCVGELQLEEIKSDEPEEKDPLNFTKAEIIDFYNKAITDSYKEKVKVTSSENVSIQINSITGGNVIKNIANSIVANYAKPTTATKQFTDGKAGDVTIGYFTACSNIDAQGVAKAVIKAKDKGCEIEITVVPETSSLGKDPKYNAQCSRPLDLSTVDLQGIEVTKADFSYSGTVLKIAVDENGRITSTDVTMPLNVKGEGKMFITAKVDAGGTYTNHSTFVY